ncbi:hypothetical protein AB0N09_39975 [Streptomyces erythrochromogenes]|uniref:hypothetical protein n=1 Tax=Streptomyces erythrochromogenes TaxID=285574 RepID=UPI003425CE36
MEAGYSFQTPSELPLEMWCEVGDCLPLSDLLHLSQVDHALYDRFPRVEVRTQEELATALAIPGLSLIVVTGAGLCLDSEPVSCAWIVTTCNITVTTGQVHARGDVEVIATGNAHVVAHERARVQAWGEATVNARDQATVYAHGRVRAAAYNQARDALTDVKQRLLTGGCEPLRGCFAW